MKEIKKILIKVTLLILLTLQLNANEGTLDIGDENAKIHIKVFSSLTCPHCANFHKNIYDNLKKEYIDKGLVKFEHHSFPLDLAALNAEIIVRCIKDKEKSFQLLDKIYENQSKWAVGSDINKINESIKKIGKNFGLDESKMNECLKNEEYQNQILNNRIEAQKKYKIESTPTIFINEKKYKGDHKYKQFKKSIEKLL